jgi:hypothetical protein
MPNREIKNERDAKSPPPPPPKKPETPPPKKSEVEGTLDAVRKRQKMLDEI